MLAVLRQRNFSLLWFAGLISITGDWALNVALPFYIYQMTGSALATGLMFMARTLPGVLWSSIAGVFVDRWDRKWTMVAVNFCATLLVLSLLVVNSTSWLWIVYLVAFVESSLMQFFVPAEKALLPGLVSEKHLVTANSLSGMNASLGMLVGPALGGALMGWSGLRSVVLVDSATYLVASTMILLIAWSPEKTAGKLEAGGLLKTWLGVWKDWLEGLRIIRRSRTITMVFLAATIAMLGEGIFQALLVLFIGILNGGAIEFGWLLTSRGLGGLLGGLIFGQAGSTFKPQRAFPWTLVGIGALLLLMFNFQLVAFALISLCLTGILAIGANATSTTLLQSGASSSFLGRIFGVFGMTAALMTLVGQGIASILGDRWGVMVMLNLAGVLYLCSGIIPLAMLKNTAKA